MLFCLKHIDFNFRGLKKSKYYQTIKYLLNQLRDVKAIFLKTKDKPQINDGTHQYTSTGFYRRTLLGRGFWPKTFITDFLPKVNVF